MGNQLKAHGPAALRDWIGNREYKKAHGLVNRYITEQRRALNAQLEQIVHYNKVIYKILVSCSEFNRQPTSVEQSNVLHAKCMVDAKAKLVATCERHMKHLIIMLAEVENTRMTGVQGDIMAHVTGRIQSMYHSDISPQEMVKQAQKTAIRMEHIRQHQDEIKEASDDLSMQLETIDEGEPADEQQQSARSTFDALMADFEMNALPAPPSRSPSASVSAAAAIPSAALPKRKNGYMQV